MPQSRQGGRELSESLFVALAEYTPITSMEEAIVMASVFLVGIDCALRHPEWAAAVLEIMTRDVPSSVDPALRSQDVERIVRAVPVRLTMEEE